jgi:formylmethanofuran--tetrahydromethanopterin N-formyltransferase
MDVFGTGIPSQPVFRPTGRCALLLLNYNPELPGTRIAMSRIPVQTGFHPFPANHPRRLNLSVKTINGTGIMPTYAEAFSMRYTRLIVTASNERWLKIGLNEFCGYATSVIGCDAEVGVESWIEVDHSPDFRPAASVLLFGFSADALTKATINRVGQCLMTCPSTAVFSGLVVASPSDNLTATPEKIPLGHHLRFFGDGFQKSKLLGDRRFWRIPVMDGEFIVEDVVGIGKGVAGGNLLIQAENAKDGLQAAERAVGAIGTLPGVITPFPGGVVRSGSKIGSRYKALRASTAHTYCPTLRGRVNTDLQDGVNVVYEIVIDGVDFSTVAEAMRVAIHAASGPGVIAISAGNYGGKLGKHLFHLHELV